MTQILNKHTTTKHPFYPYLNHELEQIQSLVESLQSHKSKRSLNFIGSAWKWIAGNPDHDDFEIIKDKMNNILENNNKQVVINQLYNERINNITKMANQIINSINKESMINDQLSLKLQYKLKLVKEELTNIKYAIHWARLGIVNSLILSNTEIKLAIRNLENENVPYATSEEALDFANIKIMSNSSCLLYIVNIPMTTNEIYEKLLIKPIKKKDKINEIAYENVLRNKNKIFGVVNNCKTINYLSICNKKDILDISNSTCVPKLLKSQISKCNKINNQHIPTVEEILEGVILLNQFTGKVIIENEIHNLNGTYLLKFHNTSVTVNDKHFISKEELPTKILPAILQPPSDENKFKEVLSLQMLKDIHINNTNQVELLRTDKTIHQYINFSFISIIIFILTVLIALKCKNRSTLKIINKTEEIKTTENLQSNASIATGNNEDSVETKDLNKSSNISTKTIPVPSRRKFYDTSFF